VGHNLLVPADWSVPTKSDFSLLFINRLAK